MNIFSNLKPSKGRGGQEGNTPSAFFNADFEYSEVFL